MSTTQFVRATAAAAIVILAACSDNQPTLPTSSASAPVESQAVSAKNVFERYVAVGTSISMGWQSDGVVAASQATSWPAQLALLAGHDLTQPYISGTGCRSPLAAPLASGLRISGEPAGADVSTLSCAPLRADVKLPVENVAISAALTRDALLTTPQNITDPGYIGLYSRVLQPGKSQVTTMVQANPRLVSVELGGNEVLNARSGIAIPGVSDVPDLRLAAALRRGARQCPEGDEDGHHRRADSGRAHVPRLPARR